MAYIDFMSEMHTSTKRDYLGRVNEWDKSECATVAKKFDYDFWDGDRKYGYGGYVYDGRWKKVAQKLVDHYKLKPGMRVLDVGCGKAHLLYELMIMVPGLEVVGIDVSQYAIDNAKEEVREHLLLGCAQSLPFEDKSFDLVISLSTLHNLYIYDLEKAIREVNRVSKKNSYIMVESYRNEKEKMNMTYWVLTCECYFKVEEWEWLYKKWDYKGDYSFIFFE